MSSEHAPGVRDKEMSAVMYNLKEQRVLEKCLQTLRLEQTYAMKLLDMDNREMKVHHKKLKDKVSKIRSFLPIEDISKFRELDTRGRFKPAYECVVLSSAVKIAEATRRLNLNSDRVKNGRCIQSALPRISVYPDNVHVRSKSSQSDAVQRSNSVMGLMMETTQETNPSRHQKPSVQFHSALQEPHCNLSTQDDDLLSDEKTRSPDLKMAQESLSVSELSPLTVSGETGGQHLRVHSGYAHSHSPFSSHVAAARDAREGLRTAPVQNNIARRLSQVSTYSIDSNLGESIYEERRLELLEEEGLRAAALEKKTRNFLREVEEYLQVKPRLQSAKSGTGNSLLESSAGKSKSYDSKGYSRHQRFHKRNKFSESDAMPTYFQEQKYKEHVLSLWTGLNKCRYLRVPDDKIDLSGINTLAKDQLQLFEVLRQADTVPLREAWEN